MNYLNMIYYNLSPKYRLNDVSALKYAVFLMKNESMQYVCIARGIKPAISV